MRGWVQVAKVICMLIHTQTEFCVQLNSVNLYFTKYKSILLSEFKVNWKCMWVTKNVDFQFPFNSTGKYMGALLHFYYKCLSLTIDCYWPPNSKPKQKLNRVDCNPLIIKWSSCYFILFSHSRSIQFISFFIHNSAVKILFTRHHTLAAPKFNWNFIKKR